MAAEPRSLTHRHPKPERLDVLVVEDHRSLRQLVVEILGHEGILAVGVGDGTEALTHLALASDAPRVVLTDLDMPIIGGRELITRMRADGMLLRIPVVLMTAAAVVPRLGRDIEVLRKPFSAELLIRSVRGALQAAKRR